MRTLILASLLMSLPALAQNRRPGCPTGVLDAKIELVDTKTGVDFVVTSDEAKGVAEIRLRARDVAAAAAGKTKLECGELVPTAKVAVRDIEGGARIALSGADPKAVQTAAHAWLAREEAGLKAPHSRLLIDAKTMLSEVWIDGIDSGYQTPTDAIILPPGKHQVSVQSPSGDHSAAQPVNLAPNETRRLYFAGK